MDEEIRKALDEKFKENQDALEELKKTGATKDELQKMHTEIEKTGNALEAFMESQKQKTIKTVSKQFGEWAETNQDEIKDVFKSGKGSLEFVPKVVGDMTTGSGADIGTPSHLLHTSVDNVNLRNDDAMLGLCSVSSTSAARFSYTETIPKEGGYAFVAEGGVKPQIDFRWENRFPAPKKIAAHEILTEESVTDVARLQSVAENYLAQKHGLFKVDGVYFGDGTGENPLGATAIARTFVAGSMAAHFANGTANFMDIVNAIVTDVYTTQNYADEPHYQPNTVMVSPIDFFKELVAAKDNQGLPLYPQAGLFSQVSIGGVTIRPWIKIPAGKIFVADMKKYNIVNYVPYSIRLGWIDDQFITNKFTMVGESRFYQYVKNLDLGAFVYDDIATVRTAIEAV